MRKILVLIAVLAVTSPAGAQQYKWTDAGGRVQYGDTPPPGVKATRLHPPAGPAAPAPGADGKGPLTPAEQDAEFRKRQADAQKAQEKDAQASQAEQAARENCNAAKQQLAELESGQRIARTNAKGERYYLEDDQRAGEIARSRKLASDWCK